MWEAIFAAVIGGLFVQHESKKQRQQVEKQAKIERQRQEQSELQAGEYWEELTEKQMELQAQSSQIRTLADVITSEETEPPQVLTLPAAKTYTPVETINRAIDRIFKGG